MSGGIDTDPNLIAALALAQQGLNVFPCDANKRPRPGVRWKEEATTDARRIESWWRRYPNSLPAFQAGRHGLLIIDLDGDFGFEDWDTVRGSHDEPTPVRIATPGGGHHLFFLQDGSFGNGRGTLPPKRKRPGTEDLEGIDIRGAGGYVVAEGAILPDGRAYEPAPNFIGLIEARATDSIPVVPDWLRAVLQPPQETLGSGPSMPEPALRPTLATETQMRRSADKPSDFFDRVKQAAMARLDAWVPALFPGAKHQPGTGAYRITSRQLGRDLEEDLSIAPNGIVDFGVADMGDPNAGKRTAIDVVMEYGGAPDARAACRWLCDQLAMDFDGLWQETHPEPAEVEIRLSASAPIASADAPPLVLATDANPVDLWGRFEAPRLPDGLLPRVIEDFAQVQAELMGVDPGGLAAAALAVCAAAIPDRVRVQVKEHDESWTESARIWVALVGDPSTKKSPMIAQATKPLKRLDGELYRSWEQAMAEYEALPKEEQRSAPRPRQTRLRIEDTTIEAAQEVLRDSPNGVLCIQDELSGWFGSMDKYSGARGSAKDRGFWLQSFNGGAYALNRIGRGSGYIDNLSVSMLGGIQPDPLRKIAAESVDDGLLQRLFPIVLGPASLGQDKPMPDVVRTYGLLVEALTQVRPVMIGLTEEPLRFDAEGQAIRREMERRHLQLMSAECFNKKLAAHIGKLDGLFARLCVLWHCVENAGARNLPPLIPAGVASRVASFLHDFLLRHSVAFYAGIMGLADDHERITAVAGYILAHKLETVTNRDVQRGDRTMRGLEHAEIRRIFEQLDALGWLKQTPGKRPTDPPHWRVDPAVHKLFADRAAAEERRRSEARAMIAELTKPAA